MDEAGLESPPLLLASVDELDFAEDEPFVDEDNIDSSLEDDPLSVIELEDTVPTSLLLETSATGSEDAVLALSSQAVRKQSVKAKKMDPIALEFILDLFRSAPG